MEKNHTVIDTPIGKLGICIEDNSITQVNFLSPSAALIPPTSPLSKKVVAQINHYFSDPNTVFDLPLHFNGTPFQHRVWQYLAKMAPGTTITYGELAKLLRTSARAIGNACRHNPIPLIVPCHRVLAKNSVGGFMGQKTGKFTNIKRHLLTHESP
jgi:methylated-DNA-[protein]-cysteine S-methyltransferase